MCLFQCVVAHDNPTKTAIVSIETDMLKMLGPKHSLRNALDQHLSNGDPSSLQNRLTSVVLNKMIFKAGIKTTEIKQERRCSLNFYNCMT